MSSSLMTSTEVARLLGVTAGTVKRWADDGLLKCARTAGRHRRFASDAVDRFRRAQAGSDVLASPFLERLLSEADVHVIQADLLAERARRGAWWRVAEWLGAELDALGRRWVEGRIGILEEHLASERLSRALSRCGEALPPRTGAPTVLLATAEREEHVLGLSLVDLCLREAGFATAWAGRRTPAAELVRTAGLGAFDAVALSASVVSDPALIAEEAAAVGEACRASGVHLLLGGRGAWPDPPPYGRLEREFEGLRRWMEDVERGRAAEGAGVVDP